MDLSTIIKEVKNLHEVVTTDLANINIPRVIPTPVHEIYPTELAGEYATPTETLLDNRKKPLLLT